MLLLLVKHTHNDTRAKWPMRLRRHRMTFRWFKRKTWTPSLLLVKQTLNKLFEKAKVSSKRFKGIRSMMDIKRGHKSDLSTTAYQHNTTHYQTKAKGKTKQRRRCWQHLSSLCLFLFNFWFCSTRKSNSIIRPLYSPS